MKVFISVFFFLILSNSNSQVKIQPKFGFEYAKYRYLSSNTPNIYLNKYSVFGGIVYNDKIDFLVSLGYAEHRANKHIANNVKLMHSISTNVLIDYRFLNDYWISPSLRLEMGGFYLSNVKNEYVNEKLELPDNAEGICETCTNQIENQDLRFFKKWGINFSQQLMASFKFHNFYLEIGGGFAYNSYNFTYLSTAPKIQNLTGFIISSNLAYRFGGNN